MRLNNFLERYIGRIKHSKAQAGVWIQCLGGVSWLAGAGLSAAWMVHGGGVARPISTFAVWATGVCFVTVRAMARTSDASPTLPEVLMALRYGGYSAAGFALGTLFCEYWPVTVSMAFLFAICRGFTESDDSAAYV